MAAPDTEWYWDLKRKVAVPADERGPGDQMMGPYRTKGEAENWKATAETRNEAWEEDDEEWESWGDDGEGSGGEGSDG
jgi:hypothetical protein